MSDPKDCACDDPQGYPYCRICGRYIDYEGPDTFPDQE